MQDSGIFGATWSPDAAWETPITAHAASQELQVEA